MVKKHGVVVQENLHNAPIFAASHDSGLTYFKIQDESRISRGDVIFGLLEKMGDQIMSNETKKNEFLASILLVRHNKRGCKSARDEDTSTSSSC